MFQRLLDSLYDALNKDPQAVPTLTIDCVPINGQLPSSYVVVIQNDILTGTVQVQQSPQGPIDPLGLSTTWQNLLIDLHDIPNGGTTILDLVNYINTISGFSASLIDESNSSLSAVALVDTAQDIMTLNVATGIGPPSDQFSVYGSLLWSIIKPVAWLLQRAFAEGMGGLYDMQPITAFGMWLNGLGSLYGYPRIVNQGSGYIESDQDYRTRLYYEVIQPKCNNLAMQEYLKWAFGFSSVQVLDDIDYEPSDPIAFKFNVIITLAQGQGLNFSIPLLQQVVDNIKAWGLVWLLILKELNIELVNLKDLESTNVNFKQALPDEWAYNRVEGVYGSINQIYIDTARSVKYYLVTNKWKPPDTYTDPHGHTQAWYSDTNDPNVVTLGRAQSYVPWVRGIVDVYFDDDGPHQYPGSDTWSPTFSEKALIGFQGQPEYSTLNPTDSIFGNIVQIYPENVPQRWKILRTNVLFNRTNDTNSLISATRTTGEWVKTVGDPSWYVIFNQ